MKNQMIYSLFFCILHINGFILRDKEGIILVPSVAFRNRTSNDWILYNQGWYYEEDPVQAYLMQRSLEKIIGKNFDLNRINLLTADGEEKKTLCMDGLNRSMCTITDDEGRIKNTFQISQNELTGFIQSNENNPKVLYQISTSNKKIQATGEIYLCDDHGITFISDIDDTIKITGVTSTTDTLINTFTGDFKPVLGMSDAYRYWQTRYNATFAYITASPDQLYPFLRQFIDRERFPAGSFHMRHFTLLDENFLSFFMSNNYISHKINTLNMLINSTLNRTFVCIGDIFQKDPDIYASTYAQYPNRIAKIFIRKYANDTSGQQRLEEVFRNIPREKWSTFEIGNDLPREIF